jgi:hypothetical protein
LSAILTALAQDHRALLAGFALMLLAAVVAYLRLLDGPA